METRDGAEGGGEGQAWGPRDTVPQERGRGWGWGQGQESWGTGGPKSELSLINSAFPAGLGGGHTINPPELLLGQIHSGRCDWGIYGAGGVCGVGALWGCSTLRCSLVSRPTRFTLPLVSLRTGATSLPCHIPLDSPVVPPPVGNTPTPRPTSFSIPPALLDPVPRGPLGVVVPPGPRDGEEVGGGTPFPIVPRGAARLLERVVRAPSVVGWGGWVLYGGGTTTLRRRWGVWGGGLRGTGPCRRGYGVG